METLTVNVIIVPDEKTESKARELGRTLSEIFESYYTLADRTFIPHATIYQAQYPVRNVEKIKDVLNKVSRNCGPFEVTVGHYENHHGYIWWNILRNENLTRLHYKILKELNPLREGLLMPHITLTGYKTGEKFTKEEAETVRKYGTMVVDKLFQPHITLAKLKHDVDQEKMYELLGKAKSSFAVSELVIGEMGDFGTVIKILQRFPLSRA